MADLTEPEVFNTNTTPPGPRIDAVRDYSGEIWWRFGDRWRHRSGLELSYDQLSAIFCPPTEAREHHT